MIRLVGALGILVATIAGAVSPAPATTRRVPLDFPTIQGAIDASVSGDTVLVAQGTYDQWQSRLINGFVTNACVYLKNGVALRSEGGAEVTVIDGGRIVGQLPQVVYVTNATSPNTSVEGFTITTSGAQIPGLFLLGKLFVSNCTFKDLMNAGSSGAGINVNGDVVLNGCTLVNCQAATGGAIFHANGTIEMTNCIVRECGNAAVFVTEEGGGPLESALVEGCLFENNGDDGALSVSYIVRPVTIRNSVFRGNVDNQSGGGAIGIGGTGTKLIEGCLFDSNLAIGANGTGGALSIRCPGLVQNNTFWGNGAYTPAGGSAANFSQGVGGQLVNNLIADGVGQGGAINLGFATITSSCNVFWDNNGGPSGEGYTPGPTDREIDPQLCDPENGDFTLNSASPCLPKNSLGCGLIGAFGPGCGTVSIQPKSWGSIKGAYLNESGEEK